MKKTAGPISSPSFVDQHAPKHEPLEQLQAMFSKDKPLPYAEWRKRLSELGRPKVTTIAPVYRPKTLMEMYSIEPSLIYRDTLDRPSHYTSDQRRLVENLFFKRTMPIEPTREQLDELFHCWMDKTQKERQEIIKRVTAPKDISDDAALEGSTGKPNYEDQDFPDLIKII